MDTYEFEFPGGSAVVTTTTGWTKEAPDFCVRAGALRVSSASVFAAETLRLASRVEELEGYVSKCEALVVRYGAELASLRAERDELESEAARLHTRVYDLNKMNANLNLRFRELEAERGVLRDRVTTLEERVRELEDESEARIWGRIESLRADLEAAKGLRDVAVGERDELAQRVAELEIENCKLRFAEARLTSLRLEVDKRGERLAHLETIIRGHETNTRLFKARIDALIAEAQEQAMLVERLRSELAKSFNENLELRAGTHRSVELARRSFKENVNLRTDLAAAIKTGEEQHCFRRDVSITLGLGKETPTIDEVRAAIQQMQDTTKKMEVRLSRLDALLASEAVPEGLFDATDEWPGELRGKLLTAVWRWFREQLRSPIDDPAPEKEPDLEVSAKVREEAEVGRQLIAILEKHCNANESVVEALSRIIGEWDARRETAAEFLAENARLNNLLATEGLYPGMDRALSLAKDWEASRDARFMDRMRAANAHADEILEEHQSSDEEV